MTTRDETRRGSGTRDLRAGAAGVDGARPDPRASASPDGGSALPERLYAARERKGVDLYRAERDTKIRARYLAALERGDYRELPGAVYTKGFLRNYALYLGLDPDEILSQWRRERGELGPVAPVIAVPRPLAAPRRGLTFSPGVVVAALLTVAVVLVAGYLTVQVMRFAKPPTLTVTHPSVATLTVDEDTTSYLLRGTTIPGGTVTVEVAGRPRQASADSTGDWSLEVELRRGRNQFKIDATDPETGKRAEESHQVVITVPAPLIQVPTLVVEQPATGTTFENGAIPVQGRTTNAATVTVAAQYDGPVEGEPASAGASPPSPSPVEVPVDEDGAFTTPLQLTTGRWSITVTAAGANGKTASLTREVTVAFRGVNLVVDVKGGNAWIKVWVDGKVADPPGSAGGTFRDGQTLTFTGNESIEVRTGSSGATFFTLNGQALGALGRRGIPETWLFEPPNPPTKTTSN